MSKAINVLVLCTGNSARSILGEALFNYLGKGRVRAFSAGSKPSGAVNPVALETLEKHSIPLPADVRSKSWDEFAAPGAPKIDYIFTVCASAATTRCSNFYGRTAAAYHGIGAFASCSTHCHERWIRRRSGTSHRRGAARWWPMPSPSFVHRPWLVSGSCSWTTS